MDFVKVSFITGQQIAEILIAELAELGFDTFEETDQGLDAYINFQDFDENALKSILASYDRLGKVTYLLSEVAKENWNEQWEKNYDPIAIDKRCRVRATFHEPDPSFEHEIVIIPKMSFGTGHHATTASMLTLEMDYDFNGKTVLDIGAGTGILAIMAMKLGADSIECTDIDTWCIENSKENFGLNDLANIQCHLGTIDKIQLCLHTYDVVLANINRNVLLKEIEHYATLLKAGGALFLSGFYEQDLKVVANCAATHNLSVSTKVIKDNWAALRLTKY